MLLTTRYLIVSTVLGVLFSGCQLGCFQKEKRSEIQTVPAALEEKSVKVETTKTVAEAFTWQAWPQDESTKKRFMIFYTGNVQGYVSPCGCTAEPLGGIARFGALKKQADDVYGKDKVFFVDAGDLLFEKETDNLPADECQTKARHELLLSTYKSLGLTTTNMTSKDMSVRQPEWPKALLQKEAIPYLYNPKLKEPLGLLKTIDVLKDEKLPIIISATAKDAIPLPPKQEDGMLHFYTSLQSQYATVIELNLNGEGQLKLDDRESKRQARIKALTKKIATYTKAITAGDARAAIYLKKVTKAQEEIKALKKPEALGPEPAPPWARFHAIPLKRGMPEDEQIAKNLKAYEDSIPTLVSQCEENIVCPEPKADEARYVGMQTCYACHQEAVKFWKNALVEVEGTHQDGTKFKRKSGHAKAWQTLVDDNKEKDRTCIGCHSVGFNKPGGYCKTSDVMDFENVQCESCHGPGSKHVAAGGGNRFIQKEVPETTCRGCHEVPHIPSYESFVYEDRLRSILGPGHGLAKLKSLAESE